MNAIFIKLITAIKRIIYRLNEIENSATCNKLVINKGGFFLSQAKVINLQNNPEKIIIGNGSYIRGEILIYPYGDGIVIGDNCYVGEGTRIWSGESISIGNNVLISHNVNIMDTNAHELNHIERSTSYINMIKYGHPTSKESIQTAPVIIEDNVWINFNVTIIKGIRIGQGAIIAAGTVVLKDVPPFVLVGGSPAKILKQLDNGIITTYDK